MIINSRSKRYILLLFRYIPQCQSRMKYALCSFYVGCVVCVLILIWDNRSLNELEQKRGFIPNESVLRRQQHCLKHPHTLFGVRQINSQKSVSIDDVLATNPAVKAGGVWSPTDCVPLHRVAIIIPYRDRWHHLMVLLSVLHPMLQRQKIQYRIIVVEQAYAEIFNKGRILNIAFAESDRKLGGFDCYIFHDVDLLPENDYNIYRCGQNPRHLSPAIDEMRYLLMYNKLAGGVLALNSTQMRNINGFSNLYWGWGAEDDDISHRIHDAGYTIERPAMNVGRYKMIRHGKRARAHNRYQLLDKWKRWPTDGVNSLSKLNYRVIAIREQPLYTNITVDIGKADGATELDQSINHVEKSKWTWN